MEFHLPNARLAAPGLYRSGALGQVDAGVLAAFTAETGLNTVIDLRTTEERRLDPEGVIPAGVRLLHIPLFDTIEPHWENPDDQSPPAVAGRYVQMYQAGRPALRQIVDLLEDPEAGPVLIHCAAGKDRTGIVVAHLLALRGLDDETIAGDYALSDAPADTMRYFLRFVREAGHLRSSS